ncbi:MAG TPA: hypothetical protein VGI20_04100 [Rhizomicrobium sp.]|jgi:hypothetical protein
MFRRLALASIAAGLALLPILSHAQTVTALVNQPPDGASAAVSITVQ